MTTLALDFSESEMGAAKETKFGKERIGRQINVVNPIRMVYPTTRKCELVDKIKTGKVEARNYDETLLRRGVTGVLDSEEQLQELALIVSKLKYGADHTLFNDLGAAINSALTDPGSNAEFYKVDHLVFQGSGKIRETSVHVSLEGLVKLVMGPLVDSKGRSVAGAAPVVKEVKRRLLDLLYAKRPTPRASATVMGPNGLVYALSVPIRIGDISSDRVFEVRIDRRFYPVQEKEGKARIKDLHIHQVAGLSSVLSFGRYILRQQKAYQTSSFPDTPEAYKAVLYIQAAMEMRKFAPSIISPLSRGRYNITFRRTPTIRELRPCAIRNAEGKISYKEVSNFISNVGRMYASAISELGILDCLHPMILIPATERGAEFPKNEGGVVYIKAQKAVKSTQLSVFA